MPAVAPEPRIAHAAAVGGVAFEGGELRVGERLARERELSNYSDRTPLNVLERGSGTKDSRRVGFITSGPCYMHIKEAFPDAPVLKLAREVR